MKVEVEWAPLETKEQQPRRRKQPRQDIHKGTAPPQSELVLLHLAVANIAMASRPELVDATRDVVFPPKAPHSVLARNSARFRADLGDCCVVS